MSANRIEKLVYWYLRFNGYLTVENFTVHPDHKKEPEAEADILAVRFPYSKEEPEGYVFDRDNELVLPDVIDFIIGESKSGMCAINKNSWGNPSLNHIQYALEWMGFLPNNPQIYQEYIDHLKDQRVWSCNGHSVRFLCFGKTINDELRETYPAVLQITHMRMMNFVYRRLTTYCNALHRENWDVYIRTLAHLIETNNEPEQLLEWTLGQSKIGEI